MKIPIVGLHGTLEDNLSVCSIGLVRKEGHAPAREDREGQNAVI